MSDTLKAERVVLLEEFRQIAERRRTEAYKGKEADRDIQA